MLFPEVAGWIVGPLSEGKTSGRGFFIWNQARQVRSKGVFLDLRVLKKKRPKNR